MTTNNTEYDTEYDSQNEVIHCMAQPSANHETEELLYVHRNRRFIRDGEPRTATSTFTQLLSSANHDGDDDDVELHVLGYRLTH